MPQTGYITLFVSNRLRSKFRTALTGICIPGDGIALRATPLQRLAIQRSSLWSP